MNPPLVQERFIRPITTVWARARAGPDIRPANVYRISVFFTEYPDFFYRICGFLPNMRIFLPNMRIFFTEYPDFYQIFGFCTRYPTNEPDIRYPAKKQIRPIPNMGKILIYPFNIDEEELCMCRIFKLLNKVRKVLFL